MNKADLVDRIAGACNISKALATTAIDTAVDSVTAALKKGDRVALIGFGTFSVSQRKARQIHTWKRTQENSEQRKIGPAIRKSQTAGVGPAVLLLEAAVGGWQENQCRRVLLPTASCDLPC